MPFRWIFDRMDWEGDPMEPKSPPGTRKSPPAGAALAGPSSRVFAHSYYQLARVGKNLDPVAALVGSLTELRRTAVGVVAVQLPPDESFRRPESRNRTPRPASLPCLLCTSRLTRLDPLALILVGDR
jgi:hypothetical protein